MAPESLFHDLMRRYTLLDIIFNLKIFVSILSLSFSILVDENRIKKRFLRFPSHKISDHSNLSEDVECVIPGRSTGNIRLIATSISKIPNICF